MYVWEQLLTNYCLDGLVYNLYHQLYITMHPFHKPWYILLYSCKALTFFVKHPISLPCYCYVLITQHHPASLAIPSNPGVHCQNLSFGHRISFLHFHPFPFHLWTNLVYHSKVLQHTELWNFFKLKISLFGGFVFARMNSVHVRVKMVGLLQQGDLQGVLQMAVKLERI